MTTIVVAKPNKALQFFKANKIAVVVAIVGCLGLLYMMAKPKPTTKQTDSAMVRVGTGATYGATKEEVTQRQADLIALQNKEQEENTGLNQGNAANLLSATDIDANVTTAAALPPVAEQQQVATAIPEPMTRAQDGATQKAQARATMRAILAARMNGAQTGQVAVVDYAAPQTQSTLTAEVQVNDTLPAGLNYGVPVAVHLITGASSDAPSDIAASISGTNYKLYGTAQRGQVDDKVEISFTMLESTTGIQAVKATALDPESKTADLQGNTQRHWLRNTSTFVQNNVTGYLAGYRSAIRGGGYNRFELTDLMSTGTEAIQQTNPMGYRKPTVKIPAGSTFYVMFTPVAATRSSAAPAQPSTDDPTIPLVYTRQ